MVRFLHLFPKQLGLNGEAGNITVLSKRLEWAGIKSEVLTFEGEGVLPTDIDALFIGSGSRSGQLEALDLLSGPSREALRRLATEGIPMLALGSGWELMGKSIQPVEGDLIPGVGIFPSSARHLSTRASAESYGFDEQGVLTTGYSNHAAEITLEDGVNSLITLKAGFGNSSQEPAAIEPHEGLIASNLMAARLNGPLLALNPHLADRFFGLIAKRSEFTYSNQNAEAITADSFAARAREELKNRLTRG
jgi:CobQ-like glutamine amidotransferase family enzyme